MLGWFGRILTFEVVADDEQVPLAILLDDASGGLINCDNQESIPGFAAHGSSIGDALGDLVELMGVELVEQGDRLQTPVMTPIALLATGELGCDADGEAQPTTQRTRAPGAERPATLALTYYDPDRDYQAGQMRSFAAGGSGRDERIELPAVLSAAQAKQLVEGAFNRRWRSGDRLRLRLPPSRMELRPGRAVQLADSSRAWVVRSASVEGMAVTIDAEEAPMTIPPLPAVPGRAVAEPDIRVGRTELGLFELPSQGDAPDVSPRAFVAASNTGLWKPVAVETTFGDAPIGVVALDRRAILGAAETALDPRTPRILDEISTVVIRLANPSDVLLNADHDMLMAGANLAVLGDELIQFGRAEQVGEGVYRLSNFLRGRRGTEWSALTHAIGDRFCKIDSRTMRSIALPANALGVTLAAIAHGIGDVSPLPVAQRPISGESARPPAPCHLKLRRQGAALLAEWVRRSHRGWTWIDGVGVADDPFPERYRLSISGPAGESVVESVTTGISLDVANLPSAIGEPITVDVRLVGPAALSHPITATIIL